MGKGGWGGWVGRVRRWGGCVIVWRRNRGFLFSLPSFRVEHFPDEVPKAEQFSESVPKL